MKKYFLSAILLVQLYVWSNKFEKKVFYKLLDTKNKKKSWNAIWTKGKICLKTTKRNISKVWFTGKKR